MTAAVIIIGIGLVAMGVFTIHGFFADTTAGGLIVPAPPTVATEAAPSVAKAKRTEADDARLEQCREKLKKSQELDLLHNMTFDKGVPKVWVGPTWYKLPIEAKIEFAGVAHCFFMAGRSDGFMQFPIYDGMSGKQIATWKYTRLDVK